ncbi:MAG: LysR family transcriptional regulator [Proteobacteria bacterium]|nr:LysR family transcriptional regulator [Pseudomonadota bacterium]
MDRITAMQVFMRVADAGSFVRAAEQLGLSTTATSRLVAELEGHLGARLLNRTTRSLSLTDAGRAYFERCEAILADLEEAEAQVGRQALNPAGVLRISAPIAFGAERLGELLSGFRQRYPQLVLDVTLADRMVDLVEEGIDLALRIAIDLDPSLVARRLTTVRIVLCAAPDYLARHGRPQTVQDLARHACLSYTNTARSGEWSFDGPAGRERVAVTGGWRANSGDLLRVAALAGEGIIRQPSFLVGEDLRQGRLLPLLPDYRVPDFTMYAVYPSRRHVPAKVRAFVDYMTEQLGDPPPWDAWMQERVRD